MNYFALQYQESRKFCRLGGQPEEVEEFCHRLIEGAPFGETFPADCAFTMSRFGGGIVAPDFVKNPFGYFIVSDTLKSVIETTIPELAAEFLPAGIEDHTGRLLDAAFFVVNILDTVDCIDEQMTEAKVDELEPQFFQWIDRLSVDTSRIGPDRHLFRLARFPRLHIASDYFRDACEGSDITGIDFIPVDREYLYM